MRTSLSGAGAWRGMVQRFVVGSRRPRMTRQERASVMRTSVVVKVAIHPWSHN
jgi:hypothetical protein